MDVEALAIGYLRGKGIENLIINYNGVLNNGEPPVFVPVAPPWKSKALSHMVGVDSNQFEEHTALGDARLAMAIYEAIIN